MVQDRSADLQSHEWYGTAISGTICPCRWPAWPTGFALCSHQSVPAVKLSAIGSRAFSVSGPQTWNQLPEEITSATSLSTFQRHLKTFLFRKAFPDIIADWHFSGPCGKLNYLGHSKKFWLIDWKMPWPWKLVSSPSRSLDISPFDRAHMTFYWRSIATIYGPILYPFRDRRRFQSEIAKFSPPPCILHPSLGIGYWCWGSNTRMMGLQGR